MAEQSSVGLSRLVALARYIDANPGQKVSEVAEHFGRTVGQMRRDISTLLDAGFDDLLPGRTIELDLDQLEREGALTLRDPLGLSEAAVLTEPDLAILLYGLYAIAPGLTREELASVPEIVSKAAALAGAAPDAPLPFIDTIGQVASGDRLDLIRSAIGEGSRLEFDYVSGSGRQSCRLVQPLSLSFMRDGWVLDAVDLGVGARRSFRLDRMSGVRPPEDRGETDETNNIEEQRDESSSATIVLDSSAAWAQQELPARRVTAKDGSIVADFSVWDQAWMRTELLLMAPHVQMVDPPELLRQTSEFAARAEQNWLLVLEDGDSEPGSGPE